uniref:Uncharacterized protein n=1 Tax=Varanus komodoensis TaxID=61221 RepID=A0A8D2KY94_VARKO
MTAPSPSPLRPDSPAAPPHGSPGPPHRCPDGPLPAPQAPRARGPVAAATRRPAALTELAVAPAAAAQRVQVALQHVGEQVARRELHRVPAQRLAHLRHRHAQQPPRVALAHPRRSPAGWLGAAPFRAAAAPLCARAPSGAPSAAAAAPCFRAGPIIRSRPPPSPAGSRPFPPTGPRRGARAQPGVLSQPARRSEGWEMECGASGGSPVGDGCQAVRVAFSIALGLSAALFPLVRPSTRLHFIFTATTLRGRLASASVAAPESPVRFVAEWGLEPGSLRPQARMLTALPLGVLVFVPSSIWCPVKLLPPLQGFIYLFIYLFFDLYPAFFYKGLKAAYISSSILSPQQPCEVGWAKSL